MTVIMPVSTADLNDAHPDKVRRVALPFGDVVRLAKTNLGIKALGDTPIRSAKQGIGAIDVPIAFENTFFDA